MPRMETGRAARSDGERSQAGRKLGRRADGISLTGRASKCIQISSSLLNDDNRPRRTGQFLSSPRYKRCGFFAEN